MYRKLFTSNILFQLVSCNVGFPVKSRGDVTCTQRVILNVSLVLNVDLTTMPPTPALTICVTPWSLNQVVPT